MRNLVKILSLVVISTLGAMGLSGCLNLKPQANPTRLYTLSSAMPESSSSELNNSAPVIGFRRIGLPEYLDNNKIAIRQGANEITYLPFHRWAEPLQAGIARQLGETMVANGMASATYTPPWRSRARFDYIFEIDISAFESRDDGTVLLDTFYSLFDHKGTRIARGRFTYNDAKWDTANYEELAAAQSRALHELALHLGTRITAATNPPKTTSTVSEVDEELPPAW